VAAGGPSALRRRTCFLSGHHPTNVDRLHHFFPRQPHSLRNTAPPHHTTDNTTQNTSPWLSSVSTRSSLTSVGTWTFSSPPAARRASPSARTTVCECGVLGHGSCAGCFALWVYERLADSISAVILPLPAVLVPSATTWYVTPCEESIPAAEAVSPKLPRWCAPTNSHTDETTVPLASNDHGPCTYNAKTALIRHPLDDTRIHGTNSENKTNPVYRATHHTPAVSSSSQSTSLPITPSSPRRSTSLPASTIPTSTRTEASAWTSCETSGARRLPSARVRVSRMRS
jgi:hypothetical protein